jgi:hypothetical protein
LTVGVCTVHFLRDMLGYRHTTPEMAARATAAVQERLTVVLQVAEQTLETHENRSALRVF